MAKTRFPAAVALFGWALCISQGAAGQEPIDGVCDDSMRNGCSAGTANDAAFPDNAASYLWRCDGQHGGANSDKCHIRVADVVDGACDDSVRNGCSAGTANDDAFADNSTGYLWRCDGLRGGRNSDKCFIRVADVPVDGVCDDTVRNGCSAGTANDDAFADNSTGYLWRCDGLRGGRNSDKCFIRVADVPVDGVCDESVRDGCSAGTANDAAVADTTSHYRWRCDGEHGGSNSGTCSRTKPPVTQVSCGGSWSPSPSTACSGQSLTQTRTCNTGCNDGDCATSRTVSGTAPPRSCEWGSWSQWGNWGACSASCGGGTQSSSRTRSKTVTEACGGACPGLPTETQSQSCNTHPCQVPCGTCNCTPGGTDAKNAGVCSNSGGSCTVSANNCPQDCGDCDCTDIGTDAKNAGVCSISGGSCTVSADNCPQDCGTCSCTAGSTDATNAGACSISGNFCLVGANNCGVTGRCDNSARNGCLSGSPNDAAIGDTASLYRWRCDGLNGGANSGTCSKSSTLCGISRESCTQGAAPSPGQCPGTEHREHFGEPCFWYCTLGGRTETCSL